MHHCAKRLNHGDGMPVAPDAAAKPMTTFYPDKLRGARIHRWRLECIGDRPLGFRTEHVLVMEASAAKEQPLEVWTQVRKLMGIDFWVCTAYARAL